MEWPRTWPGTCIAEDSVARARARTLPRNDVHEVPMHPDPKPAIGFAAALVAAILTLMMPARALDWPTRPVTVIVPFAAGGNTDMMARLGAERLTAKFGKTFIV